MIRRRLDLYHTLVLFSFILLLIGLNYLFDVGFQLNYLVVFFVGYLYGVFRYWILSKKVF
ncbi:MAG: ComEC/Rec2 family competence protein [Flavobacteriales bacterium AspAUS03]